MGLLAQGLDEFWMAMALVDGAVGGQAVDVVLSLRVPDARALCAGKDYGQRVVIVCSVFAFRFNCAGS